MSELLSIGRFAECTSLTVKALRFYDRVGLLRPVLVDVTSGYRYYSPDQVAIGRGIHRLRCLHMPLADIAVLASSDDPAEIERCLQRHQNRLLERLADYERALTSLPTTDEWCRSIRRKKPMTDERKTYQCSFCGKDNAQVARMIAGPGGVFICNECVGKCNDIINAEESKTVGTSA